VFSAFSHPVEVMKSEFRNRIFPDSIPWLIFAQLQLFIRNNSDKSPPMNNNKLSNLNIVLIHGDQDWTIPVNQGQTFAGVVPQQLPACGLSLARGILLQHLSVILGKSKGLFE